MYKKLIMGALLLSFCSVASAGKSEKKKRVKQVNYIEKQIEARAGYFLFSDSTMGSIYKDGGLHVQAAGVFPVVQVLGLYGSVGFVYANGRALGTEDKTTFLKVPVDVGLKWMFKPNGENGKMSLAGAVGPRFVFLQQTNNSLYIDPKLSTATVGAFFNSSMNYLVNDRCFVGFFSEYSFERATFSSSMPNVYVQDGTQVGGCTWGLTIGARF